MVNVLGKYLINKSINTVRSFRVPQRLTANTFEILLA